MRRSLLASLGTLLAACGVTPSPDPAEPPPGEPVLLVSSEGQPEGINVQERTCRDASECVLSRFNGCCTCPRPEPYAIHREALAVNEQHCTTVDCDETHTCEPTPVDDATWEADCQAEHCVAKER